MGTNLYYFSGTGNSLKVAKDLAQNLGDTNIISIRSVIKNSVIEDTADRIGIIFPVYMWGLPLIVKRFVEKFFPKNNTYLFAITTYGSMPATTLPQINKLLKKKNLKLSSGFGILMPGNYTPRYGALPEEKQQNMFSNEKQKIQEIAKVIRNNQIRRIEKNNFLINFIFSTIIYKLGSTQIPKMSKDFWVEDKCDGCGICVKVCPVKNVRLIEGKPKWRYKCEQCLACLQWCPQEAIQFGKKTVGRKRYRNPEINLKEISG